MAQRCFALDDVNYLAKDLRMWHIGRTDGVINATKNDFLTFAGTGMQVLVNEGYAYVRTGTDELGGVVFGSDSQESFSLSPADALLDRIDGIIIRYSKNDNSCRLVKVEGTPSSNPTKYKPIRNSTTYELLLKSISVKHGISAITQDMIMDEIMDANVCGYAKDVLAEIPTKQYDIQIKGFLENKTSEISTWFNAIKGKLNGDLATALQLQIDELKTQLTNVNDNIAKMQQDITKLQNRIIDGTEPPTAVGVEDGTIYIQYKE